MAVPRPALILSRPIFAAMFSNCTRAGSYPAFSSMRKSSGTCVRIAAERARGQPHRGARALVAGSAVIAATPSSTASLKPAGAVMRERGFVPGAAAHGRILRRQIQLANRLIVQTALDVHAAQFQARRVVVRLLAADALCNAR